MPETMEPSVTSSVTHPRHTARYWSSGHVSGHKRTSRSSAITQLNRGRSSQSLDAQEPQNGARDDGTIGGIVRYALTPHGSILVTWTMYLDTHPGHRAQVS